MRQSFERIAFVLVATTALLVMEEVLADSPPAETRLPVASSAAGEISAVTVRGGDHLWKISASRLRGVLGREASSEEVSRYWRRVIEANEGGLRSGDPDLIYPGEIVRLPNASLANG